MLKKNAEQKFVDRLDEDYKTEFSQNKLLIEGRSFDWENLNDVYKAKILSYDQNSKTVKFEFMEKENEKSIQEFTLNNFYIFNKEHIEYLYSIAKEFDSEKDSWNDYGEIDTECVYIIHNKSSDNETGYYVGQAKHGSWRFKDHIQNAISVVKGNVNKKKKKTEIQEIEKMMSQTTYTLRFIELKGSGFSNLNALESAFIAYFNSFHTGYNKTRGNNGPGNVKKTKLKDKE